MDRWSNQDSDEQRFADGLEYALVASTRVSVSLWRNPLLPGLGVKNPLVGQVMFFIR